MLHAAPHDRRRFSAQVCDLGLARVLGSTTNTETFGTVSHQPPELLMDGMLTPAVDVWSL